MPDVNLSSHALLTMIGRCLSGQWLIEPRWLLEHADLMVRADNGEKLESHWPVMKADLMVCDSGTYTAASQSDTIGKGQALGVISVIGPIYKYGWNSSKVFGGLLGQMASDERVGGVKIIVDSPGGMVHGTREVYEMVRDFSKQSLTVVDGYQASAAYYQLAASSRIVATQPTDRIGSIGTYTTYADWVKFYASFGLNLYEIYAADSTEKNEEYRQVIKSQGKETALVQKDLTAYNDQFLADVKAGRGDRLTGKGQDPLKGRLFAPAEAIENGIIDDLVESRETLAVLSDMVSTSKKSTITMSTTKKTGLVGALMHVISTYKDQPESSEGGEPTVESLTAQLTQATTERDEARGQIETLTKERDTAQTSVATLTKENGELQAKVDQYGKQPGAMPTNVQKKEGDKIPEGTESQTLEQVIASLPSEIEAAAMGFI